MFSLHCALRWVCAFILSASVIGFCYRNDEFVENKQLYYEYIPK